MELERGDAGCTHEIVLEVLVCGIRVLVDVITKVVAVVFGKPLRSWVVKTDRSIRPRVQELPRRRTWTEPEKELKRDIGMTALLSAPFEI